MKVKLLCAGGYVGFEGIRFPVVVEVQSKDGGGVYIRGSELISVGATRLTPSTHGEGFRPEGVYFFDRREFEVVIEEEKATLKPATIRPVKRYESGWSHCYSADGLWGYMTKEDGDVVKYEDYQSLFDQMAERLSLLSTQAAEARAKVKQLEESQGSLQEININLRQENKELQEKCQSLEGNVNSGTIVISVYQGV